MYVKWKIVSLLYCSSEILAELIHNEEMPQRVPESICLHGEVFKKIVLRV